jgi:putative membrane protein
MKNPFIMGTTAAIAALLMSLGVASAAEPKTAKAEHADQHFMKEAAQGGQAEVTLGQMAAKQGDNEEVKQFGQRMVDDHSKANDELKSLAATEGVTLPTGMGEKAKATQQRLAKLSGADFDRAYMEEMVKDHKKDVSEFEHEAQQGKDSEVKNWAAKTVPTLKEHLDLAENTAEKVGVKVSAADKSSESAAAHSKPTRHHQ